MALDLDGTLVDSAPDLSFSLGEALAAEGLARPELRQTTSWIGDGVEALIRSALLSVLDAEPDQGLFDRVFATFDKSYRENLFLRSQLYPGAIELLDQLAGAGLQLACITNKRESYAVDLLTQAGLSSRLHRIFGGDTFAAKKPSPEPLLRAAEVFGVRPEQAVMVGDSVNDRAAAAAAGFRFIFAAYGYSAPDDPGLRGEFSSVDSLSALGQLLCPPQTAK